MNGVFLTLALVSQYGQQCGNGTCPQQVVQYQAVQPGYYVIQPQFQYRTWRGRPYNVIEPAAYPQPQVIYQAAPVVTYAVQPVVYSQPTAQPVAAAGDPYGFTAWLNATRAAYGLAPVGYDPNLAGWAAANNNEQAARGMGHHVMGPATRQNSAVGSFPGIEAMWMASPAHRAALLDPNIRWFGIAGLGAYWTFSAY